MAISAPQAERLFWLLNTYDKSAFMARSLKECDFPNLCGESLVVTYKVVAEVLQAL